MGYYANGGGSIELLPGTDRNAIEEIMNDCWSLEYGFDAFNGDEFSLDVWCPDKYRSDDIEDTLMRLSKYTKDGEISFIGEDNYIWRFFFKDGNFHEESGSVIYDSERDALERCAGALSQIIDQELSEFYGGAYVAEIMRKYGLTDDDFVSLGCEYLLDLEGDAEDGK